MIVDLKKKSLKSLNNRKEASPLDNFDFASLIEQLLNLIKDVLAALSEGEASSIIGIIGGFFGKKTDGGDE